MKLTIEINGEEVKYSYAVGTSSCESTTKFSGDWLLAFTDALRLCSRAWTQTIEERKENMWHEHMANPPPPRKG